MTTERTRVIVGGRVQGVWFRESTRLFASEAGVAGWVRNMADGQVEAVFEGPAEKVGAAVAWCWRGPERAFVSSVQEFAEQPEGLVGFRIRY